MPHYKNTYRTNNEVTPNEIVADDDSNQSWCSKRTRLEKCTSWALGLTVFLVVAVSVVLALYLTTDVLELNKHPTSKCEREECLEAASELLHSLNDEINPCDDFYEFACGKMDKTPKSWNAFDDHETSYMQRNRRTLESPLDDKDAKIIQMAKVYYNSCMNISESKEKELMNLMNPLNLFGGWPLINGKELNKSIKYDQVRKLNKKLGFGTDYLLRITYREDFRNVTRKIIYIEPPISRTFPGMPNELKQNIEYNLELALLFGAPNTNKTMEAVEDMVEFQTKFNELCEELNKETTNKTNNFELFRIKELIDKISSVTWIDYMKESTGIRRFVKNQTVIVTHPEYLDFLKSLFEDTEQRSTLKNFLIWNIVVETAPYLPRLFFKIQALQRRFNVTAKETYSSRKDFCTVATLRDLPYVHNYLLPERSRIKSYYYEPEEIFGFIKSAFIASFNNAYGMDNNTLTIADERLSNLIYYIGTSDEEVHSLYEMMYLPTDATYLNTYKILSMFKSRQRNLLKKSNRFNENIFEKGHSIKAFYSEKGNLIYFPLESVRKLYKRNRPNYLHFSRMGFITALLTFRIIDEMGMIFDPENESKKWWTEKSEERLNHKISYYFGKEEANYTEDKKKIQWTLFNIQEGIKQSYISYQNWKQKYTNEQELPGLKYTPLQLYWISLAQLLCIDNENTVFEKNPSWDLLEIKQRVNLPLRKMERFAKDWKCCRDDNMFFRDKCC